MNTLSNEFTSKPGEYRLEVLLQDRRDPIRGEFCKRQETGGLFLVGRKRTFKIQ